MMNNACASHLCNLAYSSNDELIDAYTLKRGDELVVKAMQNYIVSHFFFSHEATNAQAYIFVLNDGSVAVAIRGTDSMHDVLRDLDVRLVDTGDGTVSHSGFVKQCEGLYSVMHEKLFEVIKDLEVKTLHITGHSAGAAIGALMAKRLRAEIPDMLITLRALGCPRFCDSVFAESLIKSIGASNVGLVKNGRDPITKLRISNVYVDVCKPEEYGRVDFYPNIPILTDMCDHSIEAYVKSISSGETHHRPLWTGCIHAITGWLSVLLRR
jgi:Lipase (class 3)